MTDAPLAIVPRRSPVQRRPGPPSKRSLSQTGGSPKVRAAINLMVWGGEDGIPLRRQDAAKAVGIADVTLRNALANPLVVKTYNEQLEVLRTSKRPRALHKIEDLSQSAESERVQLDAAKYLDGGDKSSGVTVNVGLGVNVAPGYMIDVSEHAQTSTQLLKQARSTRNALEDSQSVPQDEAGTP